MTTEILNAIVCRAEVIPYGDGVAIELAVKRGQTVFGMGVFLVAVDSGKFDLCGRFMSKVMRVSGASEWSNVVGKPVRVWVEYGSARAIGHLINDEWFSPKDFFEGIGK